jgi:hypothetical protein
MVTLKETVRLHIETNWNAAIVCGSGAVPSIRCVDPKEDDTKDADTLRDYSEIILCFNEHKIVRRKYQQNLLEDREWAVPVSIRLEIKTANTKTIFDTIRTELERILGIQVSGIDPGQYMDGPDNRTLTKGFYEARYTLYLPQFGVSASSGWTSVGTTSGYQNIIAALDSTYDLGSSAPLSWHRLYVDHILNDGAIDFMPSGDLDDYLSLTTASNVPILTITGNAFCLVKSDDATYVRWMMGEDTSHFTEVRFKKDTDISQIYATHQLQILSAAPIYMKPSGSEVDYWYFQTAASIASMLPVEDKVHLIGSAVLSADNVYSDDFTNTSPFRVFTDAIGAIKRIIPETGKTDKLDHTSVPDWVRSVHRPAADSPKDQIPPDNPNVWSVNRMVCIQWQALQQLTDALLLLANRVQSLEAKLPAKGGAA